LEEQARIAENEFEQQGQQVKKDKMYTYFPSKEERADILRHGLSSNRIE